MNRPHKQRSPHLFIWLQDHVRFKTEIIFDPLFDTIPHTTCSLLAFRWWASTLSYRELFSLVDRLFEVPRKVLAWNEKDPKKFWTYSKIFKLIICDLWFCLSAGCLAFRMADDGRTRWNLACPRSSEHIHWAYSLNIIQANPSQAHRRGRNLQMCSLSGQLIYFDSRLNDSKRVSIWDSQRSFKVPSQSPHKSLQIRSVFCVIFRVLKWDLLNLI